MRRVKNSTTALCNLEESPLFCDVNALTALQINTFFSAQLIISGHLFSESTTALPPAGTSCIHQHLILRNI